MDLFPTRYSGLTRTEVDELYRADTWASLSRDERLDALQELGNRSAQDLGIAPCEIRLQSMNGAQYGGYANGQISVNESLVESGEFRVEYEDGSTLTYSPLDTNAQLMDTIHHENFHAYQDEVMTGRLDGPSVVQVEEWLENNRNYTTESPLYRVQSIEASAFNYGEQQTAASFEAIEAKYGVDAGYQEYRVVVTENSYAAAMAEVSELEGGRQSLEVSGTDFTARDGTELSVEHVAEMDQTAHSGSNSPLSEASGETPDTSSVDARDEYAL
jgi:hypothetical protein